MHGYEAHRGFQAATVTDLIQLQLKTRDAANKKLQGNSFVLAEELSYEYEIETKKSGLF